LAFEELANGSPHCLGTWSLQKCSPYRRMGEMKGWRRAGSGISQAPGMGAKREGARRQPGPQNPAPPGTSSGIAPNPAGRPLTRPPGQLVLKATGPVLSLLWVRRPCSPPFPAKGSAGRPPAQFLEAGYGVNLAAILCRVSGTASLRAGWAAQGKCAPGRFPKCPDLVPSAAQQWAGFGRDAQNAVRATKKTALCRMWQHVRDTECPPMQIAEAACAVDKTGTVKGPNTPQSSLGQ
jgi:hypothetical protein